DRRGSRQREELRAEVAGRSEGEARRARPGAAAEGSLMTLGQRGRRLNRDSGARMALFRGLVTALIVRERIATTEAKAKEAKKVADRVIDLALRNDLHARRQLSTIVPDRTVRSEEHTSELQSRENLVCRLLLEKKNIPIVDSNGSQNIALLYRWGIDDRSRSRSNIV